MFHSIFQFFPKVQIIDFITLSWGLLWIFLRINHIACKDNEVIVIDEGDDISLKYQTRDNLLSFNNKGICRFSSAVPEHLGDKRFLNRLTVETSGFGMVINITNLQLNDSGLYSMRDSYTVKVQGKPWFQTNGKKVDTDIILVDDEKIISCEKIGSDDTEMYIKLNDSPLSAIQSLPVSLSLSKYTFTITKTLTKKFSRNDIDEILHCSSNNSKFEISAKIDMKVKTQLTLDELQPFHAGYEATVTCRSEGRPLANISWFVNNKALSNSLTKIVDNGKIKKAEHSLTFTFTKEHNGKTIVCTSNDGSSDGKILNVTYAPEDVKIKQQLNPILNGTQVSEMITCSADSNPPASFSWSFNGKIVSSEANLILPRIVTLDDNGTYICKVENLHGHSQASTDLIISYPPLCMKSVTHVNEPSVIICDVSSYPESNYTWYLVDEETPKSFSKKLDIYDSKNATYYCIGSNSFGQSEKCEYRLIFGSKMAAQVDVTMIIIPIIVVLSIVVLAVIIVIILYRRHKTKDKVRSGYELGDRNSPGPDLINTSDSVPIYAMLKKGKNKDMSEETTYQNVGRVDEAVYQNVGKPQKPPPPKKNADGLIYADLDIAKPKSGKVKQPERKENPTEYACIDFTKRPPPIQELQKSEPIYCNSTTLADSNTFVPIPPKRTLQSDV